MMIREGVGRAILELDAGVSGDGAGRDGWIWQGLRRPVFPA